MPALAASDWTVDALDLVADDGQRYEIIDGELFVTPAPSNLHQFLIAELVMRFRMHFRGSTTAGAIMSPSDLRRPDHRRRNRVQPDVYVFRMRDGVHPQQPMDFSEVLLAIEVISPGSAQYDYHVKRRLYLDNGILEYWVLNPDARNISRWISSDDPGQVFSDEIEWRESATGASLRIDLSELFRDAVGG